MTTRVVAWKKGRNFSHWHVEVEGDRTACGVDLIGLNPQAVSWIPLSEASDDICKACLSVHFHEPVKVIA